MGNHGSESGSMDNRVLNANYKNYIFSSCQALLDPLSSSNVSVGQCMVLVAARDIQKDVAAAVSRARAALAERLERGSGSGAS